LGESVADQQADAKHNAWEMCQFFHIKVELI
jgi:hypothetical protein